VRSARTTVTVLVCVALLGAAGSAGSYRVKRGDTLIGIAGRLGVSVRSLADANGLSTSHRVVAGRTLTVPGASPSSGVTSAGVRAATSYTVRTGDTVERIARRFGVSTSTLARANGLRSADLVRVGQRLSIPATSTAKVAATTPSSSSNGLPRRLQSQPTRLALMPAFDKWARAYGVPHDLLKAMTWVESGWQPHKVSSTGAVGIGQLMPDTVDFMNLVLRTKLDPRVPEHNIRMSARFLRYLLDQNRGRADSALAAYYQGLRSVRERGVFAETRQYVATVLAVRPAFG
jgi:LysM repeat protein